jgi:oligopeptide/dipeptide ABC transporter ATP-binding protein
MRPQFSIVFQEPYSAFDPRLTIGEQIGLPLRVHGAAREEVSSSVVRALTDVGLQQSVAQSLPRSLPAGVLQRAAIARAIVTRPRLVVLDEPTSSLAPEAQAEIMELLRDLQRVHGMSYLYISHDLSQVRRFCDSVAVMYLGQVVEQGSTEQIFNDPLHPYSRALLASVLRPVPGQPVENAERLSGEIPSPIDLPQGCYLASRCPYALDRCREAPQTLREVGSSRSVRCWRVEATDGEPRLSV